MNAIPIIVPEDPIYETFKLFDRVNVEAIRYSVLETVLVEKLVGSPIRKAGSRDTPGPRSHRNSHHQGGRPSPRPTPQTSKTNLTC